LSLKAHTHLGVLEYDLIGLFLSWVPNPQRISDSRRLPNPPNISSQVKTRMLCLYCVYISIHDLHLDLWLLILHDPWHGKQNSHSFVIRGDSLLIRGLSEVPLNWGLFPSSPTSSSWVLQLHDLLPFLMSWSLWSNLFSVGNHPSITFVLGFCHAERVDFADKADLPRN